MKKIFVLSLLVLFSLSSYASAEQISNGQNVSCTDAKSITIEVATIANESNDKFGFTSNDRGNANLVVWKSANATTVPITLGPNDSNQTIVDTDDGRTGFPVRGVMGASKVVLTSQEAFSRGDSIGDISGLVKITNTGTNPATVTCN